MSDPSTRAPAPATRRTYELTASEAGLIYAADRNGRDFLNQSWADLGGRHGFRWTTVADLAWVRETGPDEQLVGATFTAEPDEPVAAEEVDHDAETWMAGMLGKGPTFDKAAVLAAYVAGRDHGFTMGSAAPQPSPEAQQARNNLRWSTEPLLWMHDCGRTLDRLLPDQPQWGRRLGEIATDLIAVRYPELCPAIGRDPSPGWDGEEKKVQMMLAATALLAEAAGTFRHYERNHKDKADAAERRPKRDAADEAAAAKCVGERRAKAERNRDIAERIEALLLIGSTSALTDKLETAACLWEAVMDLERVGDGVSGDPEQETRGAAIRECRETIGAASLRMTVVGWVPLVEAAWARVDTIAGTPGNYFEGSFDWDFVPQWIVANVDWSNPQYPTARTMPVEVPGVAEMNEAVFGQGAS